MTILVNDIAASHGGALSVLKDFYEFIKSDESAKRINWIFVLSQRFFEETSHIKIHIFPKKRFNWLRRLWFDNHGINKLCNKHEVNGIISFQNTVSFNTSLPQMVYVHQVIPFQEEKNFSFLKKTEIRYAVYQHIIGRLIKASIRKADITVVQAEWIKALVSKKSGCEETKIIVNPLEFRPLHTDSSKNNQWDKQKFFYPAFESIYKNQQVLREACRILEKEGVTAEVELTVSPDKSESAIIKNVGKLSFEEVIKRYGESTLIFPSYLETIGLPLLEARNANTLILVSDCQYAHETLKGYKNAYFFNPFNPQELADLMGKVVSGEITRFNNFDYNTPKSDWSNVIKIFSCVIQKHTVR